MALAHRENSTPNFDTDQKLVAGRFRLHDRIGRGRLGDIFAATDTGPEDCGIGKRIAIQVIPEEIVRNNRLFNQLNVGYSTLRTAAHPNIVDYRQYGRDGKCGFLVMEHLAGVSLRYLLDDAGPLPLDEVKPLVCAIGDALKLLHDNDMLHGNVTARNVFITETLDVRLLDVVPLGAEQAAIPGGAGGLFSRCSAANDLIGLASLAFEMLTGKHPFDNRSPVEAGPAGLGVERIPSLSDREWHALSGALSFDHEGHLLSIDEFLAKFGSGTSRLQPSVDEPERHEPPDRPEYDPPPVATPAPPPQAPAVAADPIVTTDDRPPHARPAGTKTRMRPLLLLMLLAALAAWYQFGQPRAQLERLLDYGDENLATGPARSGDRQPVVATPNIVPPVTSEQDDADDSSAKITVEETATDDADLSAAPPMPAPSGTDTAAAQEPPTDSADSADAAKNEISDHGIDMTLTPAADSNPAETAIVPSPVASDDIPATPPVSVSERDGAVLVSLPRAGYSTSSLIWWTSEHTATADEDFIHLEAQLVSGSQSEDATVVHVPLVNDGLPEPPESFFVSLGFRDPGDGHIERIATVRVDILDDD